MIKQYRIYLVGNILQYEQYKCLADFFRLMVNLTQPSMLCFGSKIPKDTTMHKHFLDVMSYNQAYKEVNDAFIVDGTAVVIVK